MNVQELEEMLQRAASNGREISREDFYNIMTKKAFWLTHIYPYLFTVISSIFILSFLPNRLVLGYNFVFLFVEWILDLSRWRASGLFLVGFHFVSFGRVISYRDTFLGCCWWFYLKTFLAVLSRLNRFLSRHWDLVCILWECRTLCRVFWVEDTNFLYRELDKFFCSVHRLFVWLWDAIR